MLVGIRVNYDYTNSDNLISQQIISLYNFLLSNYYT